MHVWSSHRYDRLILWISVWLTIVMNMSPFLCFTPLIYLRVFSLQFVCCGACDPLEYRQLGIGVAAWTRGRHWCLFSYLWFLSLVESLWYVTLWTSCYIYHCYMSYSFWSCWTTLLFICSWDVIYQTLLFLLLNSHDYILLIFLCLVKYVWHCKCWVKIKLFY